MTETTVTGVVIRPESADDHVAIRQLIVAAFGRDAEADLVDAIRASDEYRPATTLVAQSDGRIVGHVMVSATTLRTPQAEREVALLAPLAVAPDHRGRGIGAALVRAVTEIADELGEPFVLLEGDPAFYGRLGFQPAVEHGIRLPLPEWAPAEAGQILRLGADDPDLAGVVVHPPAFADLA